MPIGVFISLSLLSSLFGYKILGFYFQHQETIILLSSGLLFLTRTLLLLSFLIDKLYFISGSFYDFCLDIRFLPPCYVDVCMCKFFYLSYCKLYSFNLCFMSSDFSSIFSFSLSLCATCWIISSDLSPRQVSLFSAVSNLHLDSSFEGYFFPYAMAVFYFLLFLLGSFLNLCIHLSYCLLLVFWFLALLLAFGVYYCTIISSSCNIISPVL